MAVEAREGGRQQVRVLSSGATHDLDRADAQLLAGAWPFRPIEVHAQAAGTEDAERRLEGLWKKGLLATRAEVLLAIDRAGGDEAGGKIEVLTVITRDRTAVLERCLVAYLSARARFQRSVPLVVIDGSSSADARSANRNLAARLGVAHAGGEEKARFVDRLADRVPDVPRRILDFALGLVPSWAGPPIGGNRNAALLAAAGRRLVSVDDDTTARIARLPPRSESLAITRAHDPTEFWFHRDVETALADAPFDPDIDPLAMHERLLGRSVSACMRTAAHVDLDGARPALLSALSGEGGRVAVTALGVVGDSGMGSPDYTLAVDGPSRARLFSHYPATRAVWR